MTNEYQIRVLPEVAAQQDRLKQLLADEYGLRMNEIMGIRILKRSIDARQRTIYVNLKVRVYVNELPSDDEYQHVDYPDVSDRRQVIVVGAGPGGLFAALRLIELGFRPIVLERGKNVHERKKDMANIARTQQVDEESNYCFGEGGAGAYSDGKLYTRSKKRGNIEKILNVFCQHGASTAILADAHPHIGTDRLPQVIENMRNTIIRCGGEVHFQTKVTRLIIEASSDPSKGRGGERVIGVETVSTAPILSEGVGETAFFGPVILATGHSARDVYRYLAEAKIEIEAKGIAVGVRLEHPSALIDQIQYHRKEGRGRWLPAAEYAFVTQVEDLDGMAVANSSLSAIDSPLKMMYFQEQLEHDCWQQGNRKQTAPAQRMADFVNGRLSFDLPKSSYAPGLVSSPLHFWMPKSISHRLQLGFRQFGKQAHGFLTNDAVMIGVETRTSSPVRIVRHPETLQHVRVQGLFPCGEGAGYAGGIVSAGVDGERCAEMCAEYMG